MEVAKKILRLLLNAGTHHVQALENLIIMLLANARPHAATAHALTLWHCTITFSCSNSYTSTHTFIIKIREVCVYTFKLICHSNRNLLSQWCIGFDSLQIVTITLLHFVSVTLSTLSTMTFYIVIMTIAFVFMNE